MIEVQDLVKRYGDFVAVDHFNLKVQKGEIYGLLGPNGCGKTTVINCILSLLRYDKGTIRLMGQPMTPNNRVLKREIGLVMQDIGVFDELTVYENIDYFCGLYVNNSTERKEFTHQAINFVGLEGFEKKQPKELSGGLLRRLNLACGIAHKPKILFLDEPTVAVDPQSRNQILSNIRDLANQGVTIIYTTHYMEEVEMICDRVTIMDKGRELVMGTPEDLKAMSMHGEVVTLEVIDCPETFIEEIKQQAAVREVNIKENYLTIHYTKGERHLVQLMTAINQHKINLLHMEVKRPSLNDVFLELTGEELRA